LGVDIGGACWPGVWGYGFGVWAGGAGFTYKPKWMSATGPPPAELKNGKRVQKQGA